MEPSLHDIDDICDQAIKNYVKVRDALCRFGYFENHLHLCQLVDRAIRESWALLAEIRNTVHLPKELRGKIEPAPQDENGIPY